MRKFPALGKVFETLFGILVSDFVSGFIDSSWLRSSVVKMYWIAAPRKMPMLLYTSLSFQVNFSLAFKQVFKLFFPLVCFDLSFHFYLYECALVCVCVCAFPVKFYVILYIKNILYLPIKLNIFYFKCW